METNNQNPHELADQATPLSWYDRMVNSFVLKLGVIFILTLMTLIPLSLVNDLIAERKNREERVTRDISSKWGSAQVVSSPILALPYKFTEESVKKDATGKDFAVHTQVEDWIFILPEMADAKVDVNPEYLQRGIYQSVVYNSKMQIRGAFGKINWDNINVNPEAINWSQAKLIVGVLDVKGLSVPPKINFANQNYGVQINGQLFNLFPNNIIADLKMTKEEDLNAPYAISYELKGSKSFNFLPLANQNKLDIKGNWGHPSFNGGYLPDHREVQDSAFSAVWNIPSFGRKLASYWVGQREIYHFQNADLSEETIDYIPEESGASGTVRNHIATDRDMVQVNFLPEVNNYQKTTRVAKYGILVIMLTFASLFFTEIIKKQRIHIIQYILIAAAMVLFYSLLLAISEHLGFNLAYFIAACATTGLIASFILMITKHKTTALLFAGILSLFYLFIYVLMQLRDYSLIAGTIGIFIILAVLMRVSTKVNWNQFEKKS
jgi:inner membrane protein